MKGARWLWILIPCCVVAVGLVVRSAIIQSGSCGYPTPSISLPPALLSDGLVSSPFTFSTPSSLEPASTAAIEAAFPDLADPMPSGAYEERDRSGTGETAIVIPFSDPDLPHQLVGAVAYDIGCNGEAYFTEVENWQRGTNEITPPIFSYPAVGEKAAARELAANPTLEFASTPLAPQWCSARRCVPAMSP